MSSVLFDLPLKYDWPLRLPTVANKKIINFLTLPKATVFCSQHS